MFRALLHLVVPVLGRCYAAVILEPCEGAVRFVDHNRDLAPLVEQPQRVEPIGLDLVREWRPRFVREQVRIHTDQLENVVRRVVLDELEYDLVVVPGVLQFV